MDPLLVHCTLVIHNSNEQNHTFSACSTLHTVCHRVTSFSPVPTLTNPLFRKGRLPLSRIDVSDPSNHPNFARDSDGGAICSGVPFFLNKNTGGSICGYSTCDKLKNLVFDKQL